jgi:hypothetical protein
MMEVGDREHDVLAQWRWWRAQWLPDKLGHWLVLLFLVVGLAIIVVGSSMGGSFGRCPTALGSYSA